MALIKCHEYGKEISDQAKACIHCGYPITRKVPQTGFQLKVYKPKKDSDIRPHNKPLLKLNILDYGEDKMSVAKAF